MARRKVKSLHRPHLLRTALTSFGGAEQVVEALVASLQLRHLALDGGNLSALGAQTVQAADEGRVGRAATTTSGPRLKGRRNPRSIFGLVSKLVSTVIPLVIVQIGLTCLTTISKLFYTAVPYIRSSDA